MAEPATPTDFREGDVLESRGMPCLPAGVRVTVCDSPPSGVGNLYVPCAKGSHFLADDDGPDFLLISRVRPGDETASLVEPATPTIPPPPAPGVES